MEVPGCGHGAMPHTSRSSGASGPSAALASSTARCATDAFQPIVVSASSASVRCGFASTWGAGAVRRGGSPRARRRCRGSRAGRRGGPDGTRAQHDEVRGFVRAPVGAVPDVVDLEPARRAAAGHATAAAVAAQDEAYGRGRDVLRRALGRVAVERADVLRVAFGALDRGRADRHGHAGAVLPALLAARRTGSSRSGSARDRSRRARPARRAPRRTARRRARRRTAPSPCSSSSAARAWRSRAYVSGDSSKRTTCGRTVGIRRLVGQRARRVAGDELLDLSQVLAGGGTDPRSFGRPRRDARQLAHRAVRQLAGRRARARAPAARRARARPAAALARRAANTPARVRGNRARSPCRADARPGSPPRRVASAPRPHRAPRAASRSRAARRRPPASPSPTWVRRPSRPCSPAA